MSQANKRDDRCARDALSSECGVSEFFYDLFTVRLKGGPVRDRSRPLAKFSDQAARRQLPLAYCPC